MKTIGEVIHLSSEFLKERKIERPKRLAEDLLSFVLKLKRMDLYLRFDQPIIEEELKEIRERLLRCGKGEPFEYVVGETQFFGCRIKVDRRVLIPRPETEILVEMIAKEAKEGVLWDLCTGSGCIGIALKKANPALQVTLSDISPDALAVARSNAELNGVDVEIVKGDLLAPFQGRKANWIVCNPPYISKAELAQLDRSVLDYEPQLALLGGERGTEFYERFKNELHFDAKIFFEIGSGQGEALKKLFPKGELHLDWAGHPRFFFLENHELL